MPFIRFLMIAAVLGSLQHIPANAQEQSVADQALELLTVSAQCPIKPMGIVGQYQCVFKGDLKTFRYECTVTRETWEADNPTGQITTNQEDTTVDYNDIASAKVCLPSDSGCEFSSHGASEVQLLIKQKYSVSFPVCDEQTAQHVVTAVDILRNSTVNAGPGPAAGVTAPSAQPESSQNTSPASAMKSVKREVSLGYLNVRSGPGQNQNVVARIPAGAKDVVVTGPCVAANDAVSNYPFCHVKWQGYSGWVSSSGLE
jgi:hypothetical protein